LKFRFWQFADSVHHVFQCTRTNFHTEYKLNNLDFVLRVQTPIITDMNGVYK